MPMDNPAIIAEMRSNGGRAPSIGDPPLVIMHTIGAKSGLLREIPIGFLQGEGDQKSVIASAGGSPTHPAWLYNVRANPEIDVEYLSELSRMRASVLDEPERTQRFHEMAAIFDQFNEYQRLAGDRIIPVVALDPLG